MKKFFLSIVILLLAVTASAAADNGSLLSCDSLVIRGNNIAQLTQNIVVYLRNNTDSDFSGRLFFLADNHTDGSHTVFVDTLVSVEPYFFSILDLYVTLPEGDLTLSMATDAEGEQVLASIDVSVSPFRKLDFSASFSLDMLTERDGENVLYGSHIRGWARVKNNDVDYYSDYHGTGDEGIVLFLEDRDTGERLFTKRVYYMLWSGGKSDANFSYDAVFRDGARYALKAAYSTAHGLELIDSLCFTTLSGTNMYWTADGTVLSLPESDDRQLTVPGEAVAVDLRGQHLFNTVFSIDASQANPNCLYYLDLLDNVPAGLDDSRNIVRGLEADNIRLKENHDYYCPLAFHTQFISYIMTPSYDNADDELRGRGYSETIVLPFSPTSVSLYDINGAAEMLHPDMLKVLRYRGNMGDSLCIEEVSLQRMLPYEPYLLGVYIGSSLLFIGEDSQVPMTGEAIVRGSGIDFVGTTIALQLSPDAYLFNAGSNSFLQGGAENIVAPFHAYMLSIDGADHHLGISDSVWGSSGKPGDATAVGAALTNNKQGITDNEVCDLQGRKVTSRHSPLTTHLKKGIYIVAGRKVVVK